MSEQPRIKVVGKDHPHRGEYGRFTGETISVLGKRMALGILLALGAYVVDMGRCSTRQSGLFRGAGAGVPRLSRETAPLHLANCLRKMRFSTGGTPDDDSQARAVRR